VLVWTERQKNELFLFVTVAVNLNICNIEPWEKGRTRGGRGERFVIDSILRVCSFEPLHYAHLWSFYGGFEEEWTPGPQPAISISKICIIDGLWR